MQVDKFIDVCVFFYLVDIIVVGDVLVEIDELELVIFKKLLYFSLLSTASFPKFTGINL